MRVSLESRYGTWSLLLPLPSDSFAITFPSVKRLLLMFAPSFSRAPVAFIPALPVSTAPPPFYSAPMQSGIA
eukprot:2468343-Rhodomonas_salina.2